MTRKQISLRKILTRYTGFIELEKPSLPRRVQILAKRKGFDPTRFYRIVAIHFESSATLIVVKSDTGELGCFSEGEVLFQDGP
jgi:hypothetical protein